MSYVEGTSGAMLQGVSQQPARLRVTGQVTEQINYDSDVNTGLTSRPGTDLEFEMTSADITMKFPRVEHLGTTYLVGHKAATLVMWTLDGTELTVNTPDGTGYLGTDMVFQSDGNTQQIMCLNRDTETAMSATIVGRAFNAAVVQTLGGLFERTYSVQVQAADGTDVTVSFTTPDGTTAGDAALTSSENIMSEIYDAFVLASTPAPMAFELAGAALCITYDEPIDITVEDGEDGAVLRFVSDNASDATDLPESAKHGHIVKVDGGRLPDDDYYLEFVSDVTAVSGDGFGRTGAWKEVADPDAANSFDVSTMPHGITISGTTATFAELAWQPRRAGDNVTNEVPSFIGGALRDIGGFEDRLVVVGNSVVRGSRTNDTLDMWKKTATELLTDDPFEVKSTHGGGATLDWVIPFDKNLLIVSDPGAAQYVITGGGVTPQNASLVLSTNYEVVSGVRPVSTGRTIILPYKNGSFVGVNEFFTDDSAATNGADPLTAVQQEYISGSISGLEVAENFSRFALRATGDANLLWVYRYLWDGTKRLQSAWFKLNFVDTVHSFFFDSSNMYVVLEDGSDSTRVVLVRMDMNRTKDDVGFHITLDRKEDFVVASNAVTVPVDNANIVQRAGCISPGLLAETSTLVDNGDGTYTHTLDADVCPNGSTVTAGGLVSRTLEPTEQQPRNFQGEVVSNATLLIRRMLVHLAQSGTVTATRTSPYRASRSFSPARFPLDDNPLDPNRLGLMDYVLSVPWNEDSTRATLSITSFDIRPDTILEIEFTADQRGVRRRIK